MKKKLVTGMLAVSLLCGATSLTAYASTDSSQTATKHHKFISEEQYKSLTEKGYQKREIGKAARIAKLSGKDINTVLDYYKQNQNWKETAKHFGVDKKKLHKHHLSKEAKVKLFQKVADMQKSTPDQVKQTMRDYEVSLFQLAVLNIISQKSNTPLNDVLKMKKDGMNVKQIAEKLNVKKEDIQTEMKKLKAELKMKKAR
ncbi:hypothetical protein SAMN04488168_12035 [Bacillus sp. 491mf]|uniref:hypothetical protein n=1 Tax=unclassified Bacillus (in: firmicutes) TaxID=185979 RepID=UPI0005576593|nr:MULTISPECIES: hypothetical protein [unclassified Bacillus (in: firmicutes)]SFD13999.1 hypothetical protein SAMN04488168_12035 [Bacillus sp. 491mf]